MTRPDRVSWGEGDGAGGRGLAVDLECCGGVQLADAVAQGDADGRAEPRHHEVQPDGPVVDSEVVCGNGGRLGRGPFEFRVQVRHSLCLSGSGELGDQVQCGRDAGGDGCRGGHGPVLDVATAAHPVHGGAALLQGADA